MAEVYLDNSATTMVCKESAEKIMEMLTLKYGNPSSLHSKGLEAERELRSTRELIAHTLGCDYKEIYFTSGGTESNNLAILGTANALKKTGNHIITTAIEHSSILEPMKELEKQGFKVTYLKPDTSGSIFIEEIANFISNDTILISIMLANNEIGTIEPVEHIKRILKSKKSKALIHSDAVQAFGKIPINVKQLGVDLLSITSHKIHGPKGCGALYISKGTKILPRTFGGEQEMKIRPGTEASPLIAGFGTAIKVLPDLQKEYEYIQSLKDYCIKRLSTIDCIKFNSKENSIAYILNFSVVGIRSETMLHFLESKNIYVSSGSACAKGMKSHVLSAIGLSTKEADSAIRVSFSRYNSKEDIDSLVDALNEGISKLIKS